MGLLPSRPSLHQTVCLADWDTQLRAGRRDGDLLSVQTFMERRYRFRPLRGLRHFLLHQLDSPYSLRCGHAAANNGHRKATSGTCLHHQPDGWHCELGLWRMVLGHISRHLHCLHAEQLGFSRKPIM